MGFLRKLQNNQHKNENSDDETQSIIDNLNHILNTKRDYGFFLQDYGMSDRHHLSSCDDIAAMIIHEINENIEKFEPRLELIDVADIKDDKIFRLSFCINCLINEKPHALKLFLDPIVDHYQVDLL